MTVFLIWDGYEDVIAVFDARHLAEKYLIDHMQQYNASTTFVKRSREHYSITEHVLNQPDAE